MDPSHKIILNNKENTSEENVLGIHLDNKLNFVYHIASLCNTSPQTRKSTKFGGKISIQLLSIDLSICFSLFK